MPLRPVFKLRGWVLSSRWSGLVQTHSWALPSGGSPGCPRCPHQQSGLRRLLPKSHKWLLTLFTHCPPLTRVRCKCSRKSDRRATGQESHGAGKPRGRWRHQHHCPHSPSTEPPSPSDLGPARTLESPSLLLPEVTLLCPTGFYSVCARPGLKNTGNPLMYGVLSPQSSVLSDSLPLPPRSQPLSPWLSDTTVTCLGSPPTPRSGCSGGSPALFLFSQGPGEHSAHGPVSENSCFMQSAQSSSCFSWEESWNPGTPSGPGAEVPGSTQLQSCFRSTQCSWGWARASCSHCETTSLPLPLSLTSPCSPSGRGHGRRLLEGTQPARHAPHNHARKEG